ncbi:hypothetical protein [Leptospira weilii]|uniref:hypothetical protein n=1 Tax=Leptospira weilii TaxID=28184 RepID=UPI0021AF4B2E|nr:hypothetical protein [Leptospira weilii]
MSKQESDYYIFRSALTENCARLTTRPWSELPRRYRTWMSGERIPIEIPQPLKHEIEPEDEGEMIPYFSAGIPLMSHVLIETLRGTGVDNLDLYRAVISETQTGRKYENYSAVNIIGLVSSVSVSKPLLGDIPINVSWFDNGLVIAPEQTHGLLLFRLTESVDLVIIHRSVKEALEKTGLPRLSFVNATDHRG